MKESKVQNSARTVVRQEHTQEENAALHTEHDVIFVRCLITIRLCAEKMSHKKQ